MYSTDCMKSGLRWRKKRRKRTGKKEPAAEKSLLGVGIFASNLLSRSCSFSFVTMRCLPSCWQNPSNAKVFGAPLESLLKDGEKIPRVVEQLIKAIEMHGLFTEGLYRKCGAAPKARELRALIEAGELLRWPVSSLF